MKLSLAMIVKNEADLIGHCLGSVRGLVDEIIVVDTGSTDATVEICQRCGASVSHFPWVDDFAAARNESLRACSGDWVLVLDADEAIDELDHAAIRRACEEAKSPAYRLILRNYFSSGTHTTLDMPVQQNTSAYSEGREYSHFADFWGLRLCRRDPDLHFEGRIHELLDPYFQARGQAILNLEAVIHHYGKLMGDREARKGRYYLDLALKDAQRDPANHQFHFNVVQQGMTVQAWPTILAAAEAYMKLQPLVPSVILFGAGVALQHMDRHQEAVAYFDGLIASMPGHAVALTQRGISLALLGRVEEARASFRRAIEAQPGFMMPFVNLTELECKLGRIEAARASVTEGLAICPADPLLLGGRVKLDILAQDLDRAVEDARTALRICPGGGDGLWHRLVALAEQRLGNRAQAQEVLRSGLLAFPDDAELIRLRSVLDRP